MNKGELTKAVAEATGMSQGEAGKAVDAVFETISGAVKGLPRLLKTSRLPNFSGDHEISERRPALCCDAVFSSSNKVCPRPANTLEKNTPSIMP